MHRALAFRAPVLDAEQPRPPPTMRAVEVVQRATSARADRTRRTRARCGRRGWSRTARSQTQLLIARTELRDVAVEYSQGVSLRGLSGRRRGEDPCRLYAAAADAAAPRSYRDSSPPHVRYGQPSFFGDGSRTPCRSSDAGADRHLHRRECVAPGHDAAPWSCTRRSGRWSAGVGDVALDEVCRRRSGRVAQVAAQ